MTEENYHVQRLQTLCVAPRSYLNIRKYYLPLFTSLLTINIPLISPPQLCGVLIALLTCPSSSPCHLCPHPHGAATTSNLYPHAMTDALYFVLLVRSGFHGGCNGVLWARGPEGYKGSDVPRAGTGVGCTSFAPRSKGKRWWLEDVRRHLIWATGWRRHSVLDF
jgi:hypothetical protein